MGEEFTPENMGEYQLLFRVPKPALIKNLLLTRQKAELIKALAPIALIHPPINQKKLAKLSHTKLIRVVKRCASISLDQVRELHDQYRYRGMKTLYLYEIEPTIPIQVSSGNLEQMNKLVGGIRRGMENNRLIIKNLEFRAWDAIRTEFYSSRRAFLFLCRNTSIY